MLRIRTHHIGDVAVICCAGRLVRSDAAYQLRDHVVAEADARALVLDLSELDAVESGGLGMLVFLQGWTRDQGIQLKLFNPSGAVRDRLERANSNSTLEIAAAGDLFALLDSGESPYWQAA